MNTKKLCCLNIPKIIEKANSNELSKGGIYYKSTVIRAKHQLEILKANNFKCSVCGAEDNLTIDHVNGLKTKRNDYRVYKKAGCIILCEKCHLEKNREQDLKRYRKINKSKQLNINVV